jgi:hypothetical protein
MKMRKTERERIAELERQRTITPTTVALSTADKRVVQRLSATFVDHIEQLCPGDLTLPALRYVRKRLLQIADEMETKTGMAEEKTAERARVTEIKREPTIAPKPEPEQRRRRGMRR